MTTCRTCGGEARPYGQQDVLVAPGEFVPCPAMDHYLGVQFPNQTVVPDPWSKPENYPGHPAYDPFKDVPHAS